MFKRYTPLSSIPMLGLQQGFKGYGSLSRLPPKPSPKSHPSYDPKRRARRSKNKKYRKNGKKKIRYTGVYASTSIKETFLIYSMPRLLRCDNRLDIIGMYSIGPKVKEYKDALVDLWEEDVYPAMSLFLWKYKYTRGFSRAFVLKPPFVACLGFAYTNGKAWHQTTLITYVANGLRAYGLFGLILIRVALEMPFS